MEPLDHSPEAIVQAFLRVINRHDVDVLTELMSPAHRFVDSLGSATEGREKMRAGWAAYFRMVPDYALAIEETYPNGTVVIMLGIAEGTYTSDGRLRPENRWQTPVAIRAYVEDDLIAEWRVFADNEPIRKLVR